MSMSTGPSTDFYEKYLQALLAGDKRTVAEIVDNLLRLNVNVREIYIDYFQRSMYEIGELWEQGKITVATEHLATSITENLFSRLYPVVFSSERLGRKAIIGSLTREYHQIGSRIVADIFELNKWDSYFLGANTPANAIMSMINDKKPDILGLSVAFAENMPAFYETCKEIRLVYPKQKIIAGGQAFKAIDYSVKLREADVLYLANISELEAFLKDYEK